MVKKYGIAWATRILGLLAFAVCFIAICLIKTRSSPQENKQPIRIFPDFSILKNFNFVIWLFGATTALTGYYVPLFYLPSKF